MGLSLILVRPGGALAPAGRLAVAKRHQKCHVVLMTASKNGTNSAITPMQVRAARGLLDWSRDQLATASSVPKRTLVRFEGADGAARPSTLAAIRAALEAAGIEFIAEDGGGPGVRLRKPGAQPSGAERRSVGPEDEDRAGPEAPEGDEVL